MRSKTLFTRREAEALDADLKAKKLRGDLLPVAGRWPLDQCWDEWLELRRPELSPATLSTYETLWEAHIRGTSLGRSSISALVAEPKLIEDHLASLKAKDFKNRNRDEADKDDLGIAAKRKLLMLLSGVFSECVRWRRISINPIREMRKPSAIPQRSARPIPPLVIERLRQILLAGTEEEITGEVSACLVSLLSYAGLRPQEALALQFRDIGKKVITVDKAITLGSAGTEIGPTKTRRKRSVPIAGALADDVSTFREHRGDAHDSDRVIAGDDGQFWTLSMYRNWRNRVWRPATKTLAATDPETLDWLASARPYDCRGSYVSLNLRAGAPPIDVAKAAGHSPAVMYGHYAEVIEELAGQPQLSADDQIRRARRLIREEAPEELAELTSESLKPPDRVAPQASALLYGPPEILRSLRRPKST
jgi:integrase